MPGRVEEMRVGGTEQQQLEGTCKPQERNDMTQEAPMVQSYVSLLGDLGWPAMAMPR